jgi:hypothetical protein
MQGDPSVLNKAGGPRREISDVVPEESERSGCWEKMRSLYVASRRRKLASHWGIIEIL